MSEASARKVEESLLSVLLDVQNSFVHTCGLESDRTPKQPSMTVAELSKKRQHMVALPMDSNSAVASSSKRVRENKELASLSSEVHYDGNSRRNRNRDRDLYTDRDDDDDPPSKPRNFGAVRFGEWVLDTWFYSPYPLTSDKPIIPSSSGSQPPPVARNRTPTIPPLASSSPKPIIPSLPHAPDVPYSNLTTLAGPCNGSDRAKRVAHVTAAKSSITLPGPSNTQMTEPSSPASLKSPPLRPALLNGKSEVNGAHGAQERAKDKMIWVCDGCFKYLSTLTGYTSHVENCKVDHPPGRKVYEKGSYSIWEVEGTKEKLYCQNLSLFGKLFIDHKTIFFDVDNFMFYILTENMYKREHAIGFFSKEIISSEDFNLACIVTFPQYQGRGYGKMLMEFSYYLTRHADSPGTPERPLSELGAIGYESFWIKNVLRTLLVMLVEAVEREGRLESEAWVKRSKEVLKNKLASGGFLTYQDFDPVATISEPTRQEACRIKLKELSLRSRVRQDDTVFVLDRLGMLASTRRISSFNSVSIAGGHVSMGRVIDATVKRLGIWAGLEIVISLDTILRGCDKWKVRGKGILDEKSCRI